MVAESKPWFKAWPRDVPKTIRYPVVPLQGLLQEDSRKISRIRQPSFTVLAKYLIWNWICSQTSLPMHLTKLKLKRAIGWLFLAKYSPFYHCLFWVLKAGVVVTAISPLHREREVEFQLSDSGAQTIVALDSLYPIVEKVKEKTQIKHVMFTRVS